MVDFIIGYAGYCYEKYNNDLIGKIRASVDTGTPVLARIKNPANGSFRVIVGYDSDFLITAEPVGAQNKPENQPAVDDSDSIYIVGGKTKSKYTLIDGLKRIKRVMDCDREAKVWDEIKFIAPHCNRIADACCDSHKRQWQVDALWGSRDWSKRFYNEWEWGMCENAVDALRIIKHDDEIIYNNVCDLINIIIMQK